MNFIRHNIKTVVLCTIVIYVALFVMFPKTMLLVFGIELIALEVLWNKYRWQGNRSQEMEKR